MDIWQPAVLELTRLMHTPSCYGCMLQIHITFKSNGRRFGSVDANVATNITGTLRRFGPFRLFSHCPADSLPSIAKNYTLMLFYPPLSLRRSLPSFLQGELVAQAIAGRSIRISRNTFAFFGKLMLKQVEHATRRNALQYTARRAGHCCAWAAGRWPRCARRRPFALRAHAFERGNVLSSFRWIDAFSLVPTPSFPLPRPLFPSPSLYPPHKNQTKVLD